MTWYGRLVASALVEAEGEREGKSSWAEAKGARTRRQSNLHHPDKHHPYSILQPSKEKAVDNASDGIELETSDMEVAESVVEDEM
ncbi:hypothetical protein EYR40_006071 [Pleurotus pulmonarius]|nr:hypothetical protein EYR36_005549 [Pleurotus pulmonarius]KAF4602853.1 hypothetical protein EYR40_006071 [Pleurotus pulmonarius]